MAVATLRLRIHLLGASALLAHLSLALLSYVQTPALWSQEDASRAIELFGALAGRFPAIGYYREFAAETVIASYWAPLAVASAAAMLVVFLLMRAPQALDESILKATFRWSLGFALACAFSYPVFTQDFWLSAAWGRMIASGINPYYALFSDTTLAGLPLDHFPMVMSYGPLWGLLSAAVAVIAPDNLWLTAVLFKALLGAAWIGSLVLVAKITAARPMLDRCLAIALFGWLPAGVSQTLAEGHNDIAMVALALLWLFLLQRANWRAPIALVASVLCKYVTAPLFLIDAIHELRRAPPAWRQFLLRLVAPALLGLGILAVFYRSPAFFDGLRVISSWHFLQPRDAVAALELLSGASLFPITIAAILIFPLLAAYRLAVCFWSPTIVSLQKSAVAIMAAVMFAGISHLWPWYVIWGLAFAVVVPTWWLSRFVAGVALLVPFTIASWWLDPFAHHRAVAALTMYVGAALWTLATRPPSRRSLQR